MTTAAIAVTWLGHSTFLWKTPEGKTILVDPWVASNPMCPAARKKLSAVDLMLITHAHFDHIGDAVAIAKEHKPKVIAIFETWAWLESKSVERGSPMNKGGTQKTLSCEITMTHAIHSCGIQDGPQIIYGGEAAGYVVKFSNGRVFYYSGDTALFSDMALIAELYRPDTVFLPIGDHFTMGPREAARACSLLKAQQVVPMHFGSFPLLTGTPAALRELLTGTSTKAIEFKPGEGKEI